MTATEAMEEAKTNWASSINRQGIKAAKKSAIVVLTPTLGQISMWWHTAMVDLLWPMNVGKGFIPAVDLKGGQVGQMRNRLIQLALYFEKSQHINLEAIMWVDDDVIVNRAVMLALAAHDRDIVSGVYMAKTEAANEPLIFDGPSSGTSRWEPDKVMEKWGYAQGLSLVKTDVYRRMAEELDLGVDEYGNPQWYKVPEFGMDAAGCLTLGGTEDFHFFENASKLGYRPLVDCTKFCFGWHYDHEKKTGYPKQQWEQFLKREPIVWPKKEGGEVIWN
jgi:hypothetical protein